MKKKLLFAGLALLLAAFACCAGMYMQQRALADKLIRLHVTAD